jgi:hypothetical protein
MWSETKYFLCLSGIILIAAMSRLLPHADNFSPLFAIALLGGSYFRKRWQAFVVPMAALVLSDYFIGFYPDAWAVYGAFLLIGALGCFVGKKLGAGGKFALLGVSSLVFYFITNTAYFFISDFYPHTKEGYLLCMISGIPFLRNALAGDIIFGGAILLSAEFLYRKSTSIADVPRLQTLK